MHLLELMQFKDEAEILLLKRLTFWKPLVYMNWAWVLKSGWPSASVSARKHPLCEKGHIQSNNGKMGSEPQRKKDEHQCMPLLSLQPQFHRPCSRTHQPRAACWGPAQSNGTRVCLVGAALGGRHHFSETFSTGSKATWHQLLPAHIWRMFLQIKTI